MSGWSRARAFPSSASRSRASTRIEQKSRGCSDGGMPIFEPGLEALVAKNAAAGRLSFTTELAAAVAGADAVFIAVGTPSRRGDGHADLSYVYAAAEEIGRALTDYAVVVTKSTVPVGTGREVAEILRRTRPQGGFDVASNPEFLREGSAIEDFMRPDRVVIGADSERRPRGDAGALSPALSARDADAVHRHRDRRADQIRGQRLSRDQDHLYQRDRRSVRTGRRRRPGRGQGHRSRRPHRPQVSACRAGLRRLLLSQGLPRAGAHRARGRGAADDRRDGGAGQRRAQGAHGRQDHRRLRRQRRRQDPGRARPDLQAQHRRHARQPEPGDPAAPRRCRGDDPRLRPRRHGRGEKAAARPRLLRGRLRGDGGRRRAGPADRVERVPRARSGAGQEPAWRPRW